MNEHIPEYERIIAHDQDIADTRVTPKWHGNETAAAVSEDLYREAKAYLDGHEVESEERLHELLEELDTSIAINNNPEARELRQRLFDRYRKEMIG